MTLTANGWKYVPLREIAEIDREGLQPEQIKAGTTFVGLENITGEGEFTALSPVQEGDIASTKFTFGPSHILYGKLRPYLRKIARPGFNGVCSTDILPILPGRQVNRDFLFHFLRQPEMVDLATARCNGANLPRLSPKILGEFLVPLPPIDEQKRITAILDKADAIRRKHLQARALAAPVTRSQFVGMFGDPKVNPKGWPKVPLTSLLAIPPSYGSMIVPRQEPDGWLDLRVCNIQKGEIDLSDKKYVVLPPEMVRRHEVHDGDLLLARAIATQEQLGKCVVAYPGQEQWAFDSHLMRLRFDSSKALPEFIHAFLNSEGGRHEFLRHSRRSAVQYNVNTKEIARIQVPIPPLKLQRTFQEACHKQRSMLAFYDTMGRKLDDLSNSLVQRAFRGEL